MCQLLLYGEIPAGPDSCRSAPEPPPRAEVAEVVLVALLPLRGSGDHKSSADFCFCVCCCFLSLFLALEVLLLFLISIFFGLFFINFEDFLFVTL